MENIMEVWLNTDDIKLLLDPQVLVYFILAIAIFFIGKLVNDIFTPYDLNRQLTTEDNKAIALSFGGYIFALGIIISGLLGGDILDSSGSSAETLAKDVADTALWGVIGIFLLQIARLVNDKLLLSRFKNVKELVEDKNVGTGAVQCASYIGSALIINVSLSGLEQATFALTLLDTFVYFILAQLAFVIFGLVYQKITRFDVHDEIEKDNVAAGVAFGMSLLAIGIVISGYFAKYDSLIGLCVWFVISAVLIVLGRVIVDKLILPGKQLDEEISKDRNWGAAIVEGSAALGIAFVLVSIF